MSKEAGGKTAWKTEIETGQSRLASFQYSNLHLLNHLLPALEVTWASSQQDIVWMPVQTEDGGANWLFDVLANPPKTTWRSKVFNSRTCKYLNPIKTKNDSSIMRHSKNKREVISTGWRKKNKSFNPGSVSSSAGWNATLCSYTRWRHSIPSLF